MPLFPCVNYKAVVFVLFLFLAARPADISAAEPPKPFTPVKATTREFDCLGRKTSLGNFLLPVQITAADKALLASPVHLFSQPDIFANTEGRAKVIDRSG